MERDHDTHLALEHDNKADRRSRSISAERRSTEFGSKSPEVSTDTGEPTSMSLLAMQDLTGCLNHLMEHPAEVSTRVEWWCKCTEEQRIKNVRRYYSRVILAILKF